MLLQTFFLQTHVGGRPGGGSRRTLSGERSRRKGSIVMYRDRSHDRPGQGRAPRQVPKRVYTRVSPRAPSPSLFSPIIRGIRGRRGKVRKLVR